MAAQLDRLLSLTAGLSNVTLGIIPFGVELDITPQSAFILFDDVAAVETLIGDTITTAARPLPTRPRWMRSSHKHGHATKRGD